MVHFTESHDVLAQDFRGRGIPIESPGFCDHPNFLVAERLDPSFLNNYAAFVATKPLSKTYCNYARTVITNAARILHQQLILHGRLGACVDISGILARILEKEGIWSFVVKGSLTVTFPPSSGLKTTYFWSVDRGAFVAGHAWVFAPPFTVVDVTVKQQPYAAEKLPFIPERALSEDRNRVVVETRDIVSPEAETRILKLGIPREKVLVTAQPDIDDILRVFSAISVQGPQGSRLKYIPVAIGMPDSPLEKMTNMNFDGKSPSDLYNDKFRGKLE